MSLRTRSGERKLQRSKCGHHGNRGYDCGAADAYAIMSRAGQLRHQAVHEIVETRHLPFIPLRCALGLPRDTVHSALWGKISHGLATALRQIDAALANSDALYSSQRDCWADPAEA